LTNRKGKDWRRLSGQARGVQEKRVTVGSNRRNCSGRGKKKKRGKKTKCRTEPLKETGRGGGGKRRSIGVEPGLHWRQAYRVKGKKRITGDGWSATTYRQARQKGSKKSFMGKQRGGEGGLWGGGGLAQELRTPGFPAKGESGLLGGNKAKRGGRKSKHWGGLQWTRPPKRKTLVFCPGRWLEGGIIGGINRGHPISKDRSRSSSKKGGPPAQKGKNGDPRKDRYFDGSTAQSTSNGGSKGKLIKAAGSIGLWDRTGHVQTIPRQGGETMDAN